MQNLQEKSIHVALVRQACGDEGQVNKKELELLQQQKRELQHKVQILHDANGAMSEADRLTLAEVLEHIKKPDGRAPAPDCVSEPQSSRTGGRGGGKPKRTRADSFEHTMAVLGQAALRMTQNDERQETLFEATARRFMDYKMQEHSRSAPAPAQNLGEDAVERRLKACKQWYEDGVIDEADYKNAVMKLLCNVTTHPPE